MKALRANGFPVPEPIAHSRHTIVMGFIDAFPLRQIREVPDPAGLYAELMELIVRLAKYGLIHGDFNEFNILVKEETKELDSSRLNEGDLIPIPTSTADISQPSPSPTVAASPASEPATLTTLTPILIDFPQMVSTSHSDAAMYFDRDVNCIKTFFQRRFHFTSDTPGPFLKDALKSVGRDGVKRLDVEAEASGFSRKMARELETYMRDVGVDGDGADGREGASNEEETDSEQDINTDRDDAAHVLNTSVVTKDNRYSDAESTLLKGTTLIDGIQAISLNDLG